MICVTGDCHGLTSEYDSRIQNFLKLSKYEDKNNYLIIAGDFGGVWRGNQNYAEKMLLRDLNERCIKYNFYLLFVDGNHEGFDVLAKLPVVEFHGGKAHQINIDFEDTLGFENCMPQESRILHLMRGEVFTFTKEDAGLNCKILAFGGARSAPGDIAYRRTKESEFGFKLYFEEELPSEEEIENMKDNLAKHNYKVDYVITHQCPRKILSLLNKIKDKVVHSDNLEEKKLLDALDFIAENTLFKRFFFGHHHIDTGVDKYTGKFVDLREYIPVYRKLHVLSTK